MEENEKSRNDKIHDMGFKMDEFKDYAAIGYDGEENFKRIKVGVKQLENAVLDLGQLKRCLPNHQFVNKRFVLTALANNDIETLRAISNFYYNIHGIYRRVCNLFANLYRYDWYLHPQFYGESGNNEKALTEFQKALDYLDNTYIRKICGEIALEVMLNGCYYGYKIDSKDSIVLQQLPAGYCRSRYKVNGKPAIEFNMKYFDTFRDFDYRMQVLDLFPDEFKKGYLLYLKDKLPRDNICDASGAWYLLDIGKAVKFNMSNNDLPPFVSVIPYLLDLDSAQDLDRRKQMQNLMKIIVQKLPYDKNGDLIFDVEEAKDIHANAVAMLRGVIGADVLTTFADIEEIDLSDTATANSTDNLERIERGVFNMLGISQNLFNTDGNLSLEKSILNDESYLRNLLLQFTMFFDQIVQERYGNKKYKFRFFMLETTQYNYQELSKMYKEQTQIGFSKMLAQVALGHSQSFILNTAYFENEVLHLSEIMIPPLMSSTLSSTDILNKTSDNEGGRPEKSDSEKSEKTIQNKESMS